MILIRTVIFNVDHSTPLGGSNGVLCFIGCKTSATEFPTQCSGKGFEYPSDSLLTTYLKDEQLFMLYTISIHHVI